MHLLEKAHAVTQKMTVDVGVLLKGFDHGIADEIVDRDVGVDTTVLEGLFSPFAERHQVAGIGSQVVGKLSGVLQRLMHGLGNELAHVGQLLVIVFVAVGEGGGRCQVGSGDGACETGA